MSAIFSDVKIGQKFGEATLNGGDDCRLAIKKMRFSRNVSLYLGNGRR